MCLCKVSNPERARGRKEGQFRSICLSRSRTGLYYSCNRIIKDERKTRRVSASPTTVSAAARAQGEWGQRPFPLRSAVCTAGSRAAGLWESVPKRQPELQGSLTQTRAPRQHAGICSAGETCPMTGNIQEGRVLALRAWGHRPRYYRWTAVPSPAKGEASNCERGSQNQKR